MTPLFYEDSLGAQAAEALEGSGSADDELVEDPEALEAAQREVNAEDPEAAYAEMEPDWVAVFGPARLSGFMSAAGGTAFELEGALDALDIPHAWDPYPPAEMPAFRPYYGAIDRPFTLLVPPERRDEAKTALAELTRRHAHQARMAPAPEVEAAQAERRLWGWLLFALLFGLPALAVIFNQIYELLRRWLP